ncbi:alginate export family protein [Bacterioplanoides pacificum]|uniref:Alginate export family protein n=1 Tax=Bacterioplanoides pacificum TaxID=1171596 RepID=A0ABV7VQW0_9GAMM
MKQAIHTFAAVLPVNAAAVLVPALLLASALPAASQAGTLSDSLLQGKPSAQLRLRYENNDSNTNNKTASALTLASRLGYQTADYHGLTLLAEVEDVRALIDDYRPQKPGYDVVADPVNSEINRLQLHYRYQAVSATIGRQRLIFDNARFVGNVGWRQNEQTFDALRLNYKKDQLDLSYAFIDQVNDILFNASDVSSHIIHLGYQTAIGKLSLYGYLLEDDDSHNRLDTFGGRFSGQQTAGQLKLLYNAELASQNAEAGNNDFSAGYALLEAGVQLSAVQLLLGNEILGSDDGQYGFSTPLATKHAFNGWADQFLASGSQGLSDRYLKLSGRFAGNKLLAHYHDYQADEGNEDRGHEVNLLLSRQFSKQFSLGVKFADYQAGDTGNDSQKLWLWGQAKF